MEMGAHGQPRSTYKKDGRVAMAYYAWNHRASYEHMSACIIVRGGKELTGSINSYRRQHPKKITTTNDKNKSTTWPIIAQGWWPYRSDRR